MTLEVQFVTLFLMIGSGAALGVCFDVIGTTSSRFRFHAVVQAVLDAAYWAAATMFVFRVLFYANYGEVRFFVFLGLAVGALLYFWLFGRAVRRVTDWILRLLERTARLIIRIIRIMLRPLVYTFRLLARAAVKIYRISAKVAVFFYRIMLQYLVLIWSKIRRRQ